jgi:NitT/TauT family transport system ATP-binding protein
VTGSALRVLIRRKAYESPDGHAVPVLEGVDFALPRHAFTCLVGPSGCGKTTMLRILLGLDHAYEGDIDPDFRTARIAAAFQEPRLLPWRTVERNIRLALPDNLADADIEGTLAAVGLQGLGDRYPAQLSLGQARRAALARAFAVQPHILFLDEPFVSLDEATAVRLRGLLLALWERDPVTVLMVTHNVREAVTLADRIVLLSERPAHVVGEVDVDIPRHARDSAAVERFAADLATRFPGLVTI